MLAEAFALSHCPEPEPECDTSFPLPFCYSLLGSTVTAGAAKLTTFLHLFTPTHCLAACANHCSPSVHYPLHFFLMNCFRNKTCLRKLQKQLGVQCSFDREFCFQRVFIVGLVLVLKNEEFDLGIWQILKRWPSAGMRVHGCSLVNSLVSAFVGPATSLPAGQWGTIAFFLLFYLIRVWFSTWVPLTFVLVHPFPLGTHWEYYHR